MNIFKQRAEEYLGKSFKDNLSRTDRRRLLAKAKKMKVSYKKLQRKNVKKIVKGVFYENGAC